MTPGRTPSSASERARRERLSISARRSACSGAGSPTTNVRAMSAQQAVSSWRGQTSTWIGSPAGSGPLPGSWPLPCQTEATITSGGQGAPFCAHACRRTARTSSASKRPAVDLQAPVRVRAAAREQIGSRSHSGLGCSLSDPNPLELDGRLCAPPDLDRRLVHREHDPVRPQPVSQRERKLGRDDRVVDPDLLHRARFDLAARLGAGEPALDELLVAELEVVEELRVRKRPSEACRLEPARQDVRLGRRPRRRGRGRRSASGSRAGAQPSVPCRRRARAHACARAYLVSHRGGR